MILPRGFIVQFSEEAKPVLHQEDMGSIPVQVKETAELKVWCYGELLTYRGRSELPLDQFIEDYENNLHQLHQLNGRFLIIILDEVSGDQILVTDRMGAFHAYAVKDQDRFIAIGSDLSTLVRRYSKRQLNSTGLFSLFAFGFFLNDWTYYDDVFILQPASMYRIGNGGMLLKFQRYWSWNHTINPTRTYKETLEQYHELFCQAVSRVSCFGETIVPISGGLDSRSIAAVIDSSVPSYSYGYSTNSIEIQIAQKVAAASKRPFTPHVIGGYLWAILDDLVLVLNGMQDVTQARQVSVSGWVSERATAVLTGLWGDVWHDDTGTPEKSSLSQEDHSLSVYRKFRKKGSDWFFDNLEPEMARQYVALLRNEVITGLEQYSTITDLDFRAKAYKTSVWAFRWSNASLRGFEIGAVPRIPFYDTDLVDFFCTVPTAFVKGRQLQIDHLKRYAPTIAQVEWQKSATNLFELEYAPWLSVFRRGYRKLVRLMKQEQVIQRNWEIQFFSPGGRDELENRLLTQGLRIHEIISQEALKELVENLYTSPDAGKGYVVSILLTAATWLELNR